MNAQQRRRTLLGGIALAAGLIAGMVSAHRADAQIVLCRDDPVILLSNLAQLDLQASVSDSATDVKQISYVVHVPAGMTVLSITDTSSLFGARSTVTVKADDAANTYDIDTTVSTEKGGAAVTANSTLISPLNAILGTRVVSGTSGQSLHSHIVPLS